MKKTTKQSSLQAIQWCCLLACTIIIGQIATILLTGKAFCLNEGCSIAEQLTTVAPIYLNITGLVYFLATFILCRLRLRKDFLPDFDLIKLLLLSGMAVEGVLLSYQLFVIHTVCSYCLIILSCIVLLNILYGKEQMAVGIPIFFAILTSFIFLNFGPTLLTLQNQTLSAGTAAIRKCALPSKQLYFFFSTDCAHCKNVLKALENCNSCEFHFNPVDKMQSLAIADLEYSPDYNPALNRLLLSLVDIQTIPVLLVRNPDGMTFIRGEENIIHFISQACFRQEKQLYMDSSLNSSPEGMSVYDAQQGECNIQRECPDEKKQKEDLGLH